MANRLGNMLNDNDNQSNKAITLTFELMFGHFFFSVSLQLIV